MKTLIALIMFSFVAVALADTYVRGYTKKDGTYVAPYYRTDSNSTRNDNYSTRGNTNPYTGKKGTKPRDNEYGSGSIYGGQKKKRSNRWR
ncbi:MAG TPA: hypothetical protein ENH40_06535 [Nitrospirae bacterium]|nr:hypothetical protein [Nitrospirota bacterium]